MDNDNNEINLLKNKVIEMSNRIEQLEEKLKFYTNDKRHIKYYENNKEVVKERTKNYTEKIKNKNPEKLKEWRHNYYLKRKERLQKQKEQQT